MCRLLRLGGLPRDVDLGFVVLGHVLDLRKGIIAFRHDRGDGAAEEGVLSVHDLQLLSTVVVRVAQHVEFGAASPAEDEGTGPIKPIRRIQICKVGRGGEGREGGREDMKEGGREARRTKEGIGLYTRSL